MEQTRIAVDLEFLCGLGCLKVTELIAVYERGKLPVELQRFLPEDRAMLVAELKSIMAVYDARSSE